MPSDDELQRYVEGSLGWRVVQSRSEPTEFDTGVQLQRLGTDEKGKTVVVSVMPGEPLHLEMFRMLCTPQSRWGEGSG